MKNVQVSNYLNVFNKMFQWLSIHKGVLLERVGLKNNTCVIIQCVTEWYIQFLKVI